MRGGRARKGNMLSRAMLYVAASVILFAAPAAFSNQLRILDSTESEITLELVTDEYSLERVVHGGEPYFRLSVPGYGHTDEEGLPRLPTKGALLGVPFGAAIGLEVVSVETERLGPRRIEPAPTRGIVRESEFTIPLEEFLPDESFYASGPVYPGTVARLGFDSTLRHQRVVRVRLCPFHYSPRSELLTLHTRIVVRLTIGRSRRPENLIPVGAYEREWEGIYCGTVLNYQQATAWRLRPRPRRDHLRLGFFRDHESYRLTVGEAGVHRLTFSELAAADFDMLLGVDEIGVYQRSYDEAEEDPFIETPVPIIVVDSDEDEIFDDDDYVLFFAQSFEQEFMPVGYEDRYTRENVYWFGWGDSIPERMAERSAWHGHTGLTPPASFRDTLRFEEDVYFDWTPPSDYVDLWHWTDYFSNPHGTYDDFRLPFSIYDVHGDGEILLRARYQGIDGGNHIIDFSVINGVSQEHAIGTFNFYGVSYTMEEDVYESPAFIAASHFTDGENTLRTQGSGNIIIGSGAALDWFEFSYLRSYAARDGRLACTSSGETGSSQFEISGFESEEIHLFDVTDPWDVTVLSLGPENVEPDNGGFRLVFQDTVDSFTRYEAVEEGSFFSVFGIERREPANLFEGEADLVVISYEGFASGVQALVERRESEGFDVAHAMLNEVYDEFGGGFPTPYAIKNYLKYAFYEWSEEPQFALLVGDASEDPRGLHDWSDKNYMPTYLYFGPGDDELSASDEWYVCFEDEDPYLPQMYIGRLPVGGTTELEMEVSKILTYESFSHDDEWRNRVLFLSDDAWSYYSTGGAYMYRSSERRFDTVTRSMASVVGSSPAGVDTTLFLLSDYTDPFHGGLVTDDIWRTVSFVRSDVTPLLLDELTEGAVIFNFQGHANRSQLTHEQVLVDPDLTPWGEEPDFDSILNDGRPFIFFGFACSVSDFAKYSEGEKDDCFSEQLLHLSDSRGAVATYASTGLEYLDPNAVFNEKIFEAFFLDPTPDGPPESYFWPRWTLGGILGKSVVKYITETGYSTAARTFILFGDPLMHLEMSPPTIRVTIDGEPYFSGDYLEATEEDQTVRIIAEIVDEVEIDPSDISIVETDLGEVPREDYTVEALIDTSASQSRQYRVTYETPIRAWFYDIEISATDANRQRTRFELHVSENERLLIRDVANSPNPFTDETKLIYLLNQTGAEVTVRIFTVGGRLIRVFKDAPSEINYNELPWDGTDDEGDSVANGVYLFTIEARDPDGRTVTAPIGKMVRAK